jgi:hypothetical protein
MSNHICLWRTGLSQAKCGRHRGHHFANVCYTSGNIQGGLANVCSLSGTNEFVRKCYVADLQLQPLPNAFELYGVDFLVSHASDPSAGAKTSQFQVQLLEMNAEPAIELTGPRLTWILEDLFMAMGKVCVQPFLSRTQGKGDRNSAGIEFVDGHDSVVRKVLDVEVRGTRAW